MSIDKDIAKIKNPAHRAIAWTAAIGITSLFGTFAILFALAFLLAGYALSSWLNLDLPAWTALLAFLGMPLGAWFELRFLN